MLPYCKCVCGIKGVFNACLTVYVQQVAQQVGIVCSNFHLYFFRMADSLSSCKSSTDDSDVSGKCLCAKFRIRLDYNYRYCSGLGHRPHLSVRDGCPIQSVVTHTFIK